MTQKRLREITQKLECYDQTDSYSEDAEKTAIIRELLTEIEIEGAAIPFSERLDVMPVAAEESADGIEDRNGF